MFKHVILFKATFNKSLWLLKRYLFNSIMMIVGLYVLFALLFFGGRQIAPTIVSDSLGALIVGYFVWTISIRAYQETSSDITKEAQWGTLEQLHLTPYGISRVVLFTSFVNVLVTLLMGVIVLGAMILTAMLVGAEVSLQLDLVTIVPITVLTVLPVVGIGLFFGGLALLFKRVGQAASLMQLVFIVFLAVPVDGNLLVKFLPLSLGTAMLTDTINDGIGLWQFPASDVVVLVGTTVLYLGGGYLVFYYLQLRARRKGVLGHY